jgi:hypothetical protein
MSATSVMARRWMLKESLLIVNDMLSPALHAQVCTGLLQRITALFGALVARLRLRNTVHLQAE